MGARQEAVASVALTTGELAAAIAGLPALGPVERAVATAELIGVCRGVLAAERARAMVEATSGRGAISRAELARCLDVTRQQVTKAVGRHG